MTGRLTILVAGMIAAVPGQGGWAWAILHYLLGLKRLGHDVWFVEPVADKAVRPVGSPLAESDTAADFRRLLAPFGLDATSALLRTGTQETVGVPYDALLGVAGRADLLLNISGLPCDPELTRRIPVRVYLDLDPAFTQLWHAQGIDMRFAGHTHFVTVGLAIGQPDCPVPTGGLPWITTLQPIVMDHWPVAESVTRDALTTVANWRGYGSVEHDGVFYGQKAHSLRRLIDLPTRTAERFELALAIHPDETKDVAALAANKWVVLDPAAVAGTPEQYREFVRGSKAEFGVAKSGYVLSRCGWFSDRSLCYLASGRPVIAQETGFGRFLPTAAGLFAFTTADDVLAAIDSLNADYPRHSRAARAIAETYFDSDVVLGRLLERIGVTS